MINEDIWNQTPQVFTKDKRVRCVHCGEDVERLYATNLAVNEKTFKLLAEISDKDTEFHMVNSEYVVYDLVGKVDDVTLKPINGMSYTVSLNVCFTCIDKIGFRHKFKRKHLKKFNTKQV